MNRKQKIENRKTIKDENIFNLETLNLKFKKFLELQLN